ncbi:MAG: LysE family transporter [Proteobacteria bacterium]|nr:LysE family transporter [Pseudomonadota bacterium]
MFGIHNYNSFILATIVFQIIPGAGTIIILNATARNGIGVGMSTVFGTIAGDFIYMLAAVLGLAAVLSVYPGILTGMQWIGLAYLCWTGLNLLRASGAAQSNEMPVTQKNWAYFRQALAVSLTNPNAIMFFMSFFPLFLNAKSRPVTLFMLMVHVTVISFLFQTGLVLVGNTVAHYLSKWQYIRLVATRLSGIALIGFGAKLALDYL